MAESIGIMNDAHRWEKALTKASGYVSQAAGSAESTVQEGLDNVIDVITSNSVVFAGGSPAVSAIRVSTYVAQLPTWLSSNIMYKDAIGKISDTLSLSLKLCDRELATIPGALKWAIEYAPFIKGNSCDCFVLQMQPVYLAAITSMNESSVIMESIAANSSKDVPAVALALTGLSIIQKGFLLTILTFNCCMKMIQEGIPIEQKIFGLINQQKFMNFKADTQLSGDFGFGIGFDLSNMSQIDTGIINPYFERLQTCDCLPMPKGTLWDLEMVNGRFDAHSHIEAEVNFQTNLLTRVQDELKCRVYCCSSSLLSEVFVPPPNPLNTSSSINLIKCVLPEPWKCGMSGGSGGSGGTITGGISSPTSSKSGAGSIGTVVTLNPESESLKISVPSESGEPLKKGDVISVVIPANIVPPTEDHKIKIDDIKDVTKAVKNIDQVIEIPIRFDDRDINCKGDDYNTVQSFLNHTLSVEKANPIADYMAICQNDPTKPIKDNKLETCRNMNKGVLVLNGELVPDFNVNKNEVIIIDKPDFIKSVHPHGFRGTWIACSESITGYYTIDTDTENPEGQALYKVEL